MTLYERIESLRKSKKISQGKDEREVKISFDGKKITIEK